MKLMVKILEAICGEIYISNITMVSEHDFGLLWAKNKVVILFMKNKGAKFVDERF